MVAEATVEELPEMTLFDRLFPWRRRRRIEERKIDRQLTRMAETVNGFKKEHGLDVLMVNIEQARARGQAAMEAATDDRPSQPRQGPQQKRARRSG